MRQRRLVVLTAIGCAFLIGSIIPRMASAQERSGFKVGVGGGVGSSHVTCRGCGEADRETGGSAYLTIGYHLNPRVRVGVDMNLWAKTYRFLDLEGEVTANLYNVTGSVTFYPQPAAGFFVKGGAGGSFMSMDIDSPGSKLSAELGTGLGVLVGAGYDIRVSRRIAITPAINFWTGRPGTLRLLGETLAEDTTSNVVDFTIGITFP